MGKKSKLKKIRRIANALPPMHGQKRVGETIFGHELLKAGVEKLSDGTPVDESKRYSRKIDATFQINHHRQMKKLYNKGGESAAVAYAENAERVYEQQKQSKQQNTAL
jgi:hypothetical protein